MTFFNLELINNIETQCSLGEGLFVNQDDVSFVDINTNKLYIFESKSLKSFELNIKPSLVFNINDKSINLFSEFGPVIFNRSLQIITSNNDSALPHDITEYRSNDGGYINESLIVGFMHRKAPEKYQGYIYKVMQNQYELIDDSIYIPNSFIQLDKKSMLISDSLDGAIWKFTFDEEAKLVSKELWTKLNTRGKPDGGCIIDDYILISLWDGASIIVLNKNGDTLQYLSVNALRPTNCKFNSKTSELWVTSATEGLTANQIKKYPESGNTFIYKLIKGYK